MEVRIKIENEKDTTAGKDPAMSEVITVHNLVILDESGSMNSIYRAALSGCNETIGAVRGAQERYANQEHRITFVTFNSYGVKTVLDDVPAADARDLIGEDFRPEGCTPLYDAIGQSVRALERKVGEGDRVLVTVITDGLENSSVEYGEKAVREMTGRLREKGWTFAYIGANQDAGKVARTLNIRSSMTFEATGEGAEEMYRRCRKGHAFFFSELADKGRDLVTCDDLPF
jgi:Mg-chelatase subunit ChlD